MLTIGHINVVFINYDLTDITQHSEKVCLWSPKTRFEF